MSNLVSIVLSIGIIILFLVIFITIYVDMRVVVRPVRPVHPRRPHHHRIIGGCKGTRWGCCSDGCNTKRKKNFYVK